MAMNLYQAHDQWANRPADERYWNLREMREAAAGFRSTAQEVKVNLREVRAVGEDGDNVLAVEDQGGQRANLTNWGFRQLAQRVGAPAHYLSTLPASLAAQNMNHGLRRLGKAGDDTNVLIHANGSVVARSFMSNSYARIWNDEVIARLEGFAQKGWRVPPARPALPDQPGARRATQEDVLNQGVGNGLSVKVGDMIAPAGLYCSDHDMFAFLVNDSVRIDDGSQDGLARGFFITNSEVGAAALKITKFLYAYVCGNHIVWDVKQVEEIKVIHSGQNAIRYPWRLDRALAAYAQESQAKELARVTSAKNKTLGKDKDEVVEVLFGNKRVNLSKERLENSFDKAVYEYENGRSTASPRTVWGFVQGVTALSKSELYAEDRVAYDRAAGVILSLAT